MTAEEQLRELEQENRHLKEQLAQRDELIERLTQRIAALEEQRRKNSRNSSLPPSFDRFVCQPKSLRKKSGKKVGGQPGHPGQSLQWSQMPDKVMLHPLASCPHCQAICKQSFLSAMSDGKWSMCLPYA